jgi:branched-chain amino acid transport system ATP-binding protein
MTTRPILQLDRVSRRFGGINAVSDVTFALAPGEIIGLIGPNGAGKTTIVNVVTGVHQATSGRVLFEGKDVTAQAPWQAARRGLARTFQIVQPFPELTVLENVQAAALFGGKHASKSEAGEIAAREVEFVGIGALMNTRASSLTLPNRKRLELAKSLAMAPRVLFLDEVNAGLNSSEIEGALDLIRMIAQRGITILIIEHLMKVVMSVSSRILVLHHGELIAEGPPSEVIRDERVVEAYLGAKYAERAREMTPHSDGAGNV